MVGEARLPSNAYYPRTPDYTLYSGVHVCWSDYSDSSFVYGFTSLDNGLSTMTATTINDFSPGIQETTAFKVFKIKLRTKSKCAILTCESLMERGIYVNLENFKVQHQHLAWGK